MLRSFLSLIGLSLLLSACMATYGTFLVSEDRNGLITFYREPLIQRQNSDAHAEIYCSQHQKPFTWLQTRMTSGGGYHDSYKCGIVPPAKMVVDEDVQEQPASRYEHAPKSPRYSKEENHPISGDYFSSKRKSSDDGKW